MTESAIEYLLSQIELNERVEEIRNDCLEVDYYKGLGMVLRDGGISQKEVDFFFFVEYGDGNGWEREGETLSNYEQTTPDDYTKLLDFFPGIKCISHIYGVEEIVVKRFFHGIRRRAHENSLLKKHN